MEYEVKNVPVSEVVAGYVDNAEEGCYGYGGRLNIRPPYQREFIYIGRKREKVIDSVRRGCPIGLMYWVKNSDGSYELLDGQQRTISLCQYVTNGFSIDHFAFRNLTAADRAQIENYRLMICVCEGTDKEKLEWFRAINEQGTELNAQELRNAILTGTWLSDAKKYFSRSNCAVVQNGYNKYLDGSAIRQDYLETALKWISARDKLEIEDYMALHQHAPNASELWLYFRKVMDWVRVTFPEYRKIMKGLDWGIFYNKYGDKTYDAKQFEADIKLLLENDDLTSSRGIYEYLFDGQERHLSIRKFSDKIKRAVYEQQNRCCKKCGKHFPLEKMHADHINPWSKEGGYTTIENCQVLCERCNRLKSDV